MHVYACTCTYMHTRVPICIHVYLYAYTRTCIHTRVPICIHTYESSCLPLPGAAFGPHWAQMLSAAVVKGDARRALNAVDKCRDDCLQASMRRVLAGPCPAPRAP